MKRIILFFIMLSAFNCTFASGHLFQIDEKALEEEFQELSTLEATVLAHPSMDVSEARDLNYLPEEFTSASADGFEGSNFSFQWEGFLWGFLCCPVGVFVVVLNKHKSKDNKTSFWIGVAANTVLSALQTIAIGGAAYTY